MSTIVTRNGKGSPLTFDEADANFTNLNNDKYQANDSPTFNTITGTTYVGLPEASSVLDGIVPASGGGTANFLRADLTWAPAVSGTTITSVVAFGVQAGNGATIGGYGLNWQGTEVLGQNPAFSFGEPELIPILTYSYNQFNAATTSWFVRNTSSWRPFYPMNPFTLEGVLGRGHPTLGVPDNSLFGCGVGFPTGADCVTSMTDFFGFVCRVADTNIQLIFRAGSTNIDTVDTGVPKTTWHDGVKCTIVSDGTNCIFSIYSMDVYKVYTLEYEDTFAIADFDDCFGSSHNIGPVYGGGTSTAGDARAALVSLQGNYTI